MSDVLLVQAYWNGENWSACSQEGGGFLAEADNFSELLGRLEQELPAILEPTGLWPAGSDELQFIVDGVMHAKNSAKHVHIRGKGWARRVSYGTSCTQGQLVRSLPLGMT